jgi:hypothetical protein
MEIKTFSVKVNGKTERLIAVSKEHAIERAVNLFKCNVKDLGKIKQLKCR